MRDQAHVTGRLSVSVRRQNGSVDRSEHQNLVVSSGAGLIAACVVGLSNPVSHMAIGGGRRPKSVDDAALQEEILRVPLLSARVDGGSAILTATFPSPIEPIFFTEAGLFNAAEGGAMLSRAVFDQQEQFLGDVVEIEWVLKISQGKP